MSFTRLVSLNLRAMETKYIEFHEMTGINYHLSPGLYLQFDKIESGGVELSPAGFLVKNPEDMTLVEQIIFSRQSKDRIEMMFKNEKVTASMNEEEEGLFRGLLDKENFTSNHTKIFYKNKECTYFGTPLEIQKQLDHAFEMFRINHVLKLEEDELSFDELRDEIYKEAYEQMQKEIRSKQNSLRSKHEKKTKDKAKKLAIASAGLGIVGGALEMTSKRMSQSSNIKVSLLSIPVKSVSRVCFILSTASSASLAQELLGGDYV